MPVIRAFSHLNVIQRSALRMQLTERLKALHAGDDQDESRADAILDALARLDTPGYGVCSECDAVISWPRLMVQPQTRLCLGCEMRSQRMSGGIALA